MTERSGPAQALLERILKAERRARSVPEWLELCDLYAELACLHPLSPFLACNRGNIHWLVGQSDISLRCFQEAVVRLPTNALVYRGLGNALLDLGRWEAAARAYRKSLELEPQADTQWNLSQLLIGLGDFKQGYALAECRWQLGQLQRWREPIEVTTRHCLDGTQPLLIWSEQGLGDTIQHLRWLGPLHHLRGPDALPITIELEPSLVQLLQTYTREWLVPAIVQAKGERAPADWSGPQAPMLSLPHLLGGAPLPQRAWWLNHRRLPTRGRAQRSRGRIGLVWAAGRKLDNAVTAREYWMRTLDQSSLGDLIVGLHGRGHDCVLLQFGEDRLLANPWLDYIADELPGDADFLETARWVAELDLVICVDTAMAHLAGWLQKPVWVLLPFCAAPRWQRQISTTPWYPTMRLFRQQKPWSWEEPIQLILNELGANGESTRR